MRQYSFRDLYPEVTNVFATREMTIPEAEEQAAYGGIAEASGKVVTTADFWKTMAFVGALVVVLYLVGIIT